MHKYLRELSLMVAAALIVAAMNYMWHHFRDTDGIRSDLDELYGLVNDVAQDQ